MAEFVRIWPKNGLKQKKINFAFVIFVFIFVYTKNAGLFQSISES